MRCVAALPLFAKHNTPLVPRSNRCTGRSSAATQGPTCAARRLVTEPTRKRCRGVTGTPAGLTTTTMSLSSNTTSSESSGSATGGIELRAPATTERARRSGQQARLAASRVPVRRFHVSEDRELIACTPATRVKQVRAARAHVSDAPLGSKSLAARDAELRGHACRVRSEPSRTRVGQDEQQQPQWRTATHAREGPPPVAEGNGRGGECERTENGSARELTDA
eukprot:scaffold218754_cov36-Tisochrysis_lutea.AAC.3